ncbi:hypothetical protein ACOI1H_23700 [Loktanella sp. DJP18]|uniref:hypothetical protein n=1 Tax=Loktanella sp. DJP18 TaxID=3409788 RepID=UPI003BB72DCE
MTEVVFGRLADLNLREAWFSEERDFTPWLLDNLDHIGGAIGLDLQPVGREVRVGPFEADILAIDARDDSRVLIENQLEAADHRHLGQIMTYVAGLKVKTVIWIASRFTDEHLSVVEWLNENTLEGFSFFAVKLRVVRIGDSPVAPILEVMQKPNGWERQLAATRRQTTGDSAIGDTRLAFWRAYISRYPEAEAAGIQPNRTSSCWCPVLPDLNLSFWVGSRESGVFVRGNRGTSIEDVNMRLAPYEADLMRQLAAAVFRRGSGFLGKSVRIALGDDTQQAELIDWMEETRRDYTRVLRNSLEGQD